MPAGSETVSLSFRADMADLRKELAKLPNVTDKEAAAMVKSLERQLKRTEAAARQAAKNAGGSMSTLGKSFTGVGGDITRLGRGIGQIFPQLGGLATSAGAIAKGMASLISPIGLVIAGFLAVGASTAGVVAGLGAAVFASDEALARLEGFKLIGDDFYPEVPDATLQSIEAVNASTAALKAIWDRTVVTLGANVAPAMEKVTNVAVGLALSAADSFDAFVSGRSILHEFAVFLVQRLVKAFLAPVDGLMSLIGLLGDLAGAVGADEIASKLSGLEEKWDGFTRGIAETAVNFYSGAAASSAWADSLSVAERRGASFTAQAELATAAVARQKEEHKAAAKAAEEAAAANEKLAEIAQKAHASTLTATEKVRAAYQEQLRDIDLLVAKGGDAALAQQARDEARAAMILELSEMEREAIETSTEQTQVLFDQVVSRMEAFVAEIDAYRQKQQDAIIGGIGNTLSAVSTLASLAAEKASESSRQQAKRLHRLAQTAGISEVAINTAVAITKALAQLGPIAGVVATAGLVAQGAAQTAVIAAQKPPQAHLGQIAPSTRFSPDEAMSPGGRRVTTSEHVIPAANAPGFAEELHDLLMNKGGRERLVPLPSPWKHLDSELDELLQRDTRTARRLSSSSRLPSRTY